MAREQLHFPCGKRDDRFLATFRLDGACAHGRTAEGEHSACADAELHKLVSN